MGCEYCDIAERNSRAQILHEDEYVIAAVKDLVLIPGQITVFPRKHFTILEAVPDDILLKCSAMAEKVSRAVFDGLGQQGTNILVHNGLGAGQKVPHFAIEVIPRRESDGLNLQWPPKEVPPEELEIVAAQLQEEMQKPDVSKKNEAEKEQGSKAEAVKTEKGADNYLVKSLRRMP
ncbi:MAG: HIT family protein [Nanoarchaeota archaeon]